MLRRVTTPGATASARLAAFAADLSLDDVPAPVREAAALHVLDTLGCGLAAVATGAAEPVRALAEASAPGGASSVLGVRHAVPAQDAAFANAALCHALDFDDTHSRSICHVGTVVVPAAVALAQELGSSGAELLCAIVAGNETVARIGAVAAPAYMRTGFHHTGVCGCFGATVAAAKLLGLDALRTRHALGICGSLASGSFSFLDDGSTAKVVNAGAAARAGVLAAQLAAHGADGPAPILEGRFGLFASYFRIADPQLDAELDQLGVAWETPEIAFKPYPACHFLHSSLDAAREACERLGVLGDPDAVTEITVNVPAPALPLVLEPRVAKIRPRTPYEGKFSLQYSVAAMVVHGKVGVASYAPAAIEDPETLRLAERVSHRAADFDTYPDAFPARVSVFAGQRAETVEVAFQRGGAERPLTLADVIAKFTDNAELALDQRDAGRLRERVLGLEQLDGVSELASALAAARSPEHTTGDR